MSLDSDHTPYYALVTEKSKAYDLAWEEAYRKAKFFNDLRLFTNDEIIPEGAKYDNVKREQIVNLGLSSNRLTNTIGFGYIDGSGRKPVALKPPSSTGTY